MRMESPRFFQIIQDIGMVAAFIGGIPMAIAQIETTTGMAINLPEVVDLWLAQIVFWCGVLTKFLAKLPVKPKPPMDHGEPLTPTQAKAALPFTEKHDSQNGATTTTTPRKKSTRKKSTDNAGDEADEG